MKLDCLKENKELVSTALLVVSALSAILIMVKVAGFFVASAKAESAVRGAIKSSEPDAKNVTAQSDKSKEIADALKKSNLFSPPAPKQNPIKTVMGIFGDEALINGKWYKAGDNVADAKILAVNPISVETEWDGKKKTFYPIDAGGPQGPSGSSRPKRLIVGARKTGSAGAATAQMIVTKSDPAKKKPQGTKAEKTKDPLVKEMSRAYKSFSDEQKEAFKRVMKARSEQYKQMDGQDKAHFKARIIERISQSGK